MKPKAKDIAAGKWRPILSTLGVPDDVLDGHHHPCPADGDGTDRFRFADRSGTGSFFCRCSDGDKGGMALLMCCRGWSYAEAAAEVERIAGGVQPMPEQPKPDPRIALNKIRKATRKAGALVAPYLRSRGLEVPPGLLEAELPYWHDGKVLGTFACMVGLILSPQGKPQSYHITYLDGAKKADVPSPRKIMTPVDTIAGCAVRLYPAAAEMGAGEGIETSIAASQIAGVPVWAALNSGNLEKFEPPPECTHLRIFGDSDPSYAGQASAYTLAKRRAITGIKVDVHLPFIGDWNDAIMGAAPVPPINRSQP